MVGAEGFVCPHHRCSRSGEKGKKKKVKQSIEKNVQLVDRWRCCPCVEVITTYTYNYGDRISCCAIIIIQKLM